MRQNKSDRERERGVRQRGRDREKDWKLINNERKGVRERKKKRFNNSNSKIISFIKSSLVFKRINQQHRLQAPIYLDQRGLSDTKKK